MQTRTRTWLAAALAVGTLGAGAEAQGTGSWRRSIRATSSPDDIVVPNALAFGPTFGASSGLYCAGSRRPDALSTYHGFVQRVDDEGAVLDAWSITPPDSTDEIWIHAAAGDSDDFVGVGSFEEGQGAQPWLFALDPVAGSVRWNSVLTDLEGELNDVVALNGGWAVTGYVASGNEDVFVALVDANGQLVWSRALGDPEELERGQEIIATQDGNLVVASYAKGGRVRLSKLDTSGTTLWTQDYDPAGIKGAWLVSEAPNGDLWLGSTLTQLNLMTQWWVARLDSDGVPIFENSYQAFGGHMRELEATSDGGCIAAGSISGILVGNRAAAAKLDPQGVPQWWWGYSSFAGSSQHQLDMIVDSSDRAIFSLGWFGVVELDWVYGLTRLRTTGEICSTTLGWNVQPAPKHSVLSTPSIVSTPLAAGPGPKSLSIQGSIVTASLSCSDACPGQDLFCMGAANSNGSGAYLYSTGSTVVGDNDFSMRAYNIPPKKVGAFFYGPNEMAPLPFGDGYLCVGAPRFRLPVTIADENGFVEQKIDLTSPPNQAAQITNGSSWFFQFWYRDPAAQGTGFNVSLGRRISFCN